MLMVWGEVVSAFLTELKCFFLGLGHGAAAAPTEPEVAAITS